MTETMDYFMWTGFILLFLSLVAFLLLLVPLQGVVTRYRINYTPRGVGLGELGDGDEQRLSQDMRVGPVVNSVWAMFGRVKRLEGYSGFFKGLMPLLLLGFANYIVGLLIIGVRSSPRKVIHAGGPISSVFWAVALTLIAIPGEVLVNRAVTTPHRLGWFSPRTSLQALFTPYELRRPWVLYLTPGLALSQTLHVLYYVTIARGLRGLLIPFYEPNSFFLNNESVGQFGGFWAYVGMGIYTIFLCASFVVLTPLEVLSARLSVQRNHQGSNSRGTVLPTSDPDTEPASAAANGGAQPILEYAGEEEDVIALRDEDAPYSSLVDAYKKVIEEEGRGTLYRCWWLTLLATLATGFA